MIKAWIDYLFWKRTWFRVVGIVIPTLPLAVVFLIRWVLGTELDPRVAPTIVILFWAAAMIDNDNLDGCDENMKDRIRRKYNEWRKF